MTHPQKGFIVPLLLILIALILAGGGAYVFMQKKVTEPVTEAPVTQTTSSAQTAATPIISSVTPSEGILTWGYDSGTPITITGTNFTYRCTSDVCTQQPHVFVHIIDSNGHTNIVGNNGPGSATYPNMVFTINASGTAISLAAIPFDIGTGISPGKYLLSVSVDGMGTSNEYPITITAPNR